MLAVRKLHTAITPVTPRATATIRPTAIRTSHIRTTATPIRTPRIPTPQAIRTPTRTQTTRIIIPTTIPSTIRIAPQFISPPSTGMGMVIYLGGSTSSRAVHISA